MQICVLLNHIISGLDDEKRSYGLLHNLQDGMLQPDQCRILYAFLTNMAMLALFLLLMARVTLALTLILHLNLEFYFLVEPLPKSIRNVTFVAIQPMSLIRATLLTSPSLILATLVTSLSLILLSHSLTMTTKVLQLKMKRLSTPNTSAPTDPYTYAMGWVGPACEVSDCNPL